MNNILKNFNLTDDVINEIEQEQKKWSKGYRYCLPQRVKGKKYVSKGKRIAQIVRNFFLQNSKTKNVIMKNKFDIEKICKFLNIEIIRKADLVIDRKLNPNANEDDYNIWGMFDKPNRKIYTSKQLTHENPERFTIAHELGHLFIDDQKSVDIFFRDKAIIGEETIINDFAANFLVDFDELTKFLNENNYNFKEASKEFGVPYGTIAVLLEENEKFTLNNEANQ